MSRAYRVEKLGVAGLEASALARIQQLQDRWWNATHQSSTLPQQDRDEAVTRYENLTSLIHRFIGSPLERDQDGHPTLFDYPIGDAPLSDGQKILLQFCVAIHAQADKLSELIVLMDEPENHLHPGAMLDAISQIQNALTDGQLWIATHSIPLLAHFDPDDIWWMEDGGVAHAGSMPEKVLTSLLGDDDRIARLNDFLGLPAALASTRFAQQCLLPPAVLTTGADDPQTRQIAGLLSNHRPGERLRLLDIGSGRGRLISALREGWTSDGNFTDRFDYRAFDLDPTHQAECEAAIARVYGVADRRAFYDDSDLRSTLDHGSVDVAIMCNVLHEIDVTGWMPLFSPHGTLRRLLNENGYLCLIEDTEMRIGEQAHQRGFLVLDTAALKILFDIGEDAPGFLSNDARGDGRLQAHVIPKRYLGNATNVRLREALREVRHKAMTHIKELRNGRGSASYRDGRRHAFHVQQLANAELALDVIGDPA